MPASAEIRRPRVTHLTHLPWWPGPTWPTTTAAPVYACVSTWMPPKIEADTP